MGKKLAALALSSGILLAGGGPLVGAAHANTPTPTPTVRDCQVTFATQGLALIQAYQSSAKDQTAAFFLQTGILAAGGLYNSCVSAALR